MRSSGRGSHRLPRAFEMPLARIELIIRWSKISVRSLAVATPMCSTDPLRFIRADVKVFRKITLRFQQHMSSQFYPEWRAIYQ